MIILRHYYKQIIEKLPIDEQQVCRLVGLEPATVATAV